MTTRQTPDAVREAITAAITKADASFGYSYRLTKMDETGEEHTLFMDGFEPAVFSDREDGYPVIEQRRNAARTDAILAALDSRAGDAVPVDAKDEYPAFAGWWSRTIPHEAVPSSASHHFDAWMASARRNRRAGDAGEVTDAMVDATLAARLPGGTPVLAYLPTESTWEPTDRAKEIVRAILSATAAPEPFGYWVEQKHADPVLLRKPAYIPEPSDLRTVTPLYAAPAVDAVPAGEVEQ